MIVNSAERGSSWLAQQSEKCDAGIRFLLRQTRMLLLVVRHPDAGWLAKSVAGCTVGYLLSPIQLIPTFIPLIGQLDDLAVLFLGLKLLRMLTPASVLAECDAKAMASTPQLRQKRETQENVGTVPAMRFPIDEWRKDAA